jgi:hypothetical protein
MKEGSLYSETYLELIC